MSFTNLNYGYRRDSLLASSRLVSSADIWTPTSTQKYALGCEMEIPLIGRFRYCKDSGTGSAVALMQCSEPVDAQAIETAQTAYGVSAGETKFDILCTTGNALSDHELIDGYLLVNKGTAIGTMYTIKDNYWITSDTVMMVEIADQGGIRVAIPATDEITLVKNLCRDTKLNPTTQDAVVVGVTRAVVTASYYYWAQYKGVCPLMVDAGDTVVVGEPIGKAGTAGTAGAGGLIANDGTDATWGTVIYPATTAEVALVLLDLPSLT